MRRTAAQLSYLLRKRIRLYANERKRKRDNEVRRFFTDKFLRNPHLFPRGVRQKQAIREARGFRERSVQHRTRRSENASATTKRAAFSRTSSYVTPTYFLAAFVKNKQFAKRAASANGAYNTVRDGAKTQARQQSAPLFHGRRINRRAQKSPYASPRRRTPRIFSPFRLRRKRGR